MNEGLFSTTIVLHTLCHFAVSFRCLFSALRRVIINKPFRTSNPDRPAYNQSTYGFIVEGWVMKVTATHNGHPENFSSDNHCYQLHYTLRKVAPVERKTKSAL